MFGQFVVVWEIFTVFRQMMIVLPGCADAELEDGGAAPAGRGQEGVRPRLRGPGGELYCTVLYCTVLYCTAGGGCTSMTRRRSTPGQSTSPSWRGWRPGPSTRSPGRSSPGLPSGGCRCCPCTVFCCTVLYFTILYHIVLYCAGAAAAAVLDHPGPAGHPHLRRRVQRHSLQVRLCNHIVHCPFDAVHVNICEKIDKY